MKTSLFITSFLSLAASVQACDLCSSYTPRVEALKQSEHGFSVSLAEQFTHFGSIRIDGHEVDDPANQTLDSSITQLVVGQSFLDHRLNLQATLPYIDRDYKRAEGSEIDRGVESGFGDASLLASYEVFQYQSQPQKTSASTSKNAIELEPIGTPLTVSLRLNGGIKFPTGDASRLSEEFAEGHDHEAHEHEEEGVESGVHGHDLALGTGSYDALFGAEIFVRYGQFFLEAETQFTLRGDGRYSYHYANDLTWSAGLGGYVLDRPDSSITIQLASSGETKDTDRFQGRVANDTGITAVYLGPKVVASYKQISAELGFELPIFIDNTALQIVPDYRLKAAISFHF